ncbi:MAG: hypothetical protein ACE5HN_04700 [Nitrospiria bacterium]
MIFRLLGYTFSIVIVLAVLYYFDMIQILPGFLKEAVETVITGGIALKEAIF